MSGLVIRDKNGENISYSGSRFEGMEDLGEQHLYLRTGNGPDDVVKYALTSKPLNDKYKALRMRISSGADGKEAYIAQRYVDTQSVETTVEYTSTRSSGFVSTITNTTQSTTSNSTRVTTRSSSQTPEYYGNYPMSTSSSSTNNFSSNGSYTGEERYSLLSFYMHRFGIDNLKFISNSSSSSTYTEVGLYNNLYRVNVTTCRSYKGYTVMELVTIGICSITRTVTSRVSTFVQNFVSSIASRTSTQTINMSRTSGYTSSSSASATETFVTNNVDL